MQEFKLPSYRIPIAVTVAALAVITLAPSTLAARPTREVIDIGTPEIEALIAEHQSDACGFEISVVADATIRVMVFTDKDGNFRREIDQAHLDWTLTNVRTGATSRLLSVGPDVYWTTRDGIAMHASVGIVLSESGLLIGRTLTNDTDGTLVRSAGRVAGDAEQVFCAPLRP